jgi:hypothetical protein
MITIASFNRPVSEREEQNRVFLQITGERDSDIEIPGREFTFATLITARAII